MNNAHKTHYGLARLLVTLSSLAGWVFVTIGIIIIVLIPVTELDFTFSISGIGAVLSGLALLLGSQVTLATIDIADHTRAILQKLDKN